jgi:caffeoyl-CoA O-methyltransferase
MNITDPSISKYITEHSTPEDALLAELNRETHLKVLYPNMLSGHIQGNLLELISCMIKPRYILEIGTYTGYSAICLAKGLQNDGKLITIERNDELTEFSKKYFAKTGLDSKIEIITGDALDIIPKLPYTFDLVFLDADKKDYIRLYHLFIDKVNPGGIILADNVLWYGKVLDSTGASDPDTLGIKTFNELIRSDARVKNIILPIRDGINLIYKL